jgi:hypothetical protein
MYTQCINRERYGQATRVGSPFSERKEDVMDKNAPREKTLNITMKMREFVIPPITDALVLGRKAPIGIEAMQRALTLLHIAPFVPIQIKEDEVIEAILVREAMLKKIPEEKLIEVVQGRVKSFMSPEEVIHLDLHPELTVRDQV